MQKYHIHKYAQNMHKYAKPNYLVQICINMHFQNMHKYVFYMHKYA